MKPLWKLVPADRLLVSEETTYPVDASELPPGVDPRLAEYLVTHGTHVDKEYVAEVDGGVIEPARGWIVRAPHRLVRESLPWATRLDAPSPFRYAAKRALGRSTVKYDEVLSLRDKHDLNYWHTVGDVLPRLLLFERTGFSLELPIVVARHLFDAPYFRAFVHRAGLERAQWIVQNPGLHVRSRRVYVCRAFRYRKSHFDHLLSFLHAGAVEGERRIFVTRRTRYRSLTNLAEIERIAESAGFDVIDPGDLSADEQIDAFAAARFVVGVHGAGLANVLWRAGGALDVLELFSPTWFDPSYFELSRLYGFGYAALVGESEPEYEFSIPAARFVAALERLVTG